MQLLAVEGVLQNANLFIYYFIFKFLKLLKWYTTCIAMYCNYVVKSLGKFLDIFVPGYIAPFNDVVNRGIYVLNIITQLCSVFQLLLNIQIPLAKI